MPLSLSLLLCSSQSVSESLQRRRRSRGTLLLSPDLLTLSHFPKSQVEHLEAGQLGDALQAPLGDAGAAVEVDACELAFILLSSLQMKHGFCS